LVAALVKPGAETARVVVPLPTGTNVKFPPVVVEFAPTPMTPVADAEFTPPLNSAPTVGTLLVSVTVTVPVSGLTGCGLSAVPPLYSAPTIALNVLDPARFVVLVGGPDIEIPDVTVIAGRPAGEENRFDGSVAVMVLVPTATPCSQKLALLCPAGISTLIVPVPTVAPFAAPLASASTSIVPGALLVTWIVIPPAGAGAPSTICPALASSPAPMPVLLVAPAPTLKLNPDCVTVTTWLAGP
jgi:hypothetical protein